MAPTRTEGSESLDCMVLTLYTYIVVTTGTGLWRVMPRRSGSEGLARGELVSFLCCEPAQSPHYTEGPSQDPAPCGWGAGAGQGSGSG